jgi:hypothetical protein
MLRTLLICSLLSACSTSTPVENEGTAPADEIKSDGLLTRRHKNPCGEEREPNDSAAAADESCAWARGQLSLDSDVDWWVFDVPADTDYMFMFPQGRALSGTLYKQSASGLREIGKFGWPETSPWLYYLHRYTETGGTYYARVSGTQGDYQLTLTLHPESD